MLEKLWAQHCDSPARGKSQQKEQSNSLDTAARSGRPCGARPTGFQNISNVAVHEMTLLVTFSGRWRNTGSVRGKRFAACFGAFLHRLGHTVLLGVFPSGHGWWLFDALLVFLIFSIVLLLFLNFCVVQSDKTFIAYIANERKVNQVSDFRFNFL